MTWYYIIRKTKQIWQIYVTLNEYEITHYSLSFGAIIITHYKI